MSTLAVTGADGLVGSHFCRHFARRGWSVRALVRDPARPPPLPAAGAPVPRFLCSLPEGIDAAGLTGVDVLVHCAYATRARDLAAARQINVDGTRALLAQARAARVGRFVFVSSLSARADARSYYGRSKHELEQALDAKRDLILRPGLVLAAEGAGLFQRLRAEVARSRFVPVFTGDEAILQTVHADDLCSALERALDLGIAGALNVAEPDGWPFVRFLRELAARLGRPITPVRLPAGPSLWTLRILEALRMRLPVTSENLLGLFCMRHRPTAVDLDRLGLRLRTAAQSLDELVGPVIER